MRYKGVQRHKGDPIKFRVSIKFSVPGNGIRGYTHIHNWLKSKFGNEGFGVHPVRWDPHAHSIAVYFNDPAAAPEIASYIEDIIGERISYELTNSDWGVGPSFYSGIGALEKKKNESDG